MKFLEENGENASVSVILDLTECLWMLLVLNGSYLLADTFLALISI